MADPNGHVFHPPHLIWDGGSAKKVTPKCLVPRNAARLSCRRVEAPLSRHQSSSGAIPQRRLEPLRLPLRKVIVSAKRSFEFSATSSPFGEDATSLEPFSPTTPAARA